jgi:hypothetical protein
MKRLAFLVVLTACASHPAAAPATPTPPAPTSPPVTHPIEPGRLEDATGYHELEEGEPRVKVDGNVVAVYVCRPDGQEPAFVADDHHHAYVTFFESKLEMPTEGRPQMKPPEYCSFQRFVMPDGVTYVGELKQ